MGLRRITILLIIAIAAQQIQGAADAPVIPDTTTEPPPETTTTQSSTTTESTSTTESSSTSTTESSTTESSTTTSTTTEAPPAPTPPQPTPKPGPIPNPDLGKWHFRNETSNQTCIIVQMAVQLNFTYTLNDTSMKTVLYNLPANSTTVLGGFCDSEKNWLQLGWKNNNKALLAFSVNSTVKEYQLAQLQFDLNVTDIFADAKANQLLTLVHKKTEFATPLTMSYHCARQQVLNLTSADAQEVTLLGQALLTRLQLEAFNTHDNGDKFSTAKDCDSIDTPDIVPIAVGCALAGLVVIVLIAYLVGRRRSSQRGYMSM